MGIFTPRTKPAQGVLHHKTVGGFSYVRVIKRPRNSRPTPRFLLSVFGVPPLGGFSSHPFYMKSAPLGRSSGRLAPMRRDVRACLCFGCLSPFPTASAAPFFFFHFRIASLLAGVIQAECKLKKQGAVFSFGEPTNRPTARSNCQPSSIGSATSA